MNAVTLAGSKLALVSTTRQVWPCGYVLFTLTNGDGELERTPPLSGFAPLGHVAWAAVCVPDRLATLAARTTL